MSTVAGDLVIGNGRASGGDRGLWAGLWRAALGIAALLSEMPFLDHLEELRSRIIRCLIAIAIGMTVSITYAAELIRFLKIPAKNAGVPLVAIESTEVLAFMQSASLLPGCLENLE